jgi:nuclear RNA export factor
MSDTREPSQTRYSNNNNFRGRARGRGGVDSRGEHSPLPQERAEAANETKALLEGFIARRYNVSAKYLDLSSIVSDEPVLRSGMFENERTQKKFFPALMVVCDTMLPSRKAKVDAIDSISLANNGAQNLNVVYELVNYMNHIKNLDLSNNAFSGLDKLKPWKGRFKFLEHLIVDPFPDMNWEEEVTSWFPTLKRLNNKQVRPEAGAGANMVATPTPPPQAPFQAPATMSAEEIKKEEMIAFVQQATNLNRHYAVQCLEAAAWDLQQASDLFAGSRDTLPPEAFGA